MTRIAQRFRRTRSTIYRAIHEQRAAALRRVEISFVMSPLFAHEDVDQVVLFAQSPPPRGGAQDQSPSPPPRSATRGSGRPGVPRSSSGGKSGGTSGSASGGPVSVADLPEPLAVLYGQALLSPESEGTLLVQYNYLKFRAARIRDNLDRYEPRVQDLEQVEQDLAQAARIRDRLVAANLGRVLRCARQQLTGESDRALPVLVELLALGNRVLIEAIEQFDSSLGKSFETRLTWNLMRRFAEVPSSPTRAHRRLDAATVRRRMEDEAARHGVSLGG